MWAFLETHGFDLGKTDSLLKNIMLGGFKCFIQPLNMETQNCFLFKWFMEDRCFMGAQKSIEIPLCQHFI